MRSSYIVALFVITFAVTVTQCSCGRSSTPNENKSQQAEKAPRRLHVRATGLKPPQPAELIAEKQSQTKLGAEFAALEKQARLRAVAHGVAAAKLPTATPCNASQASFDWRS